MKKRLLSLVLVLTIIVSSAIFIHGEEKTEADLAQEEWTESDFTFSGGSVTGLTDAGIQKLAAKQNVNADADLKFPAMVNSTEINSIGDGAFREKNITGTVTFHGNISDVGNSAFQGNPRITKVVVEENSSNSILFGIDSFNPISENYDETYGRSNYDKNKEYFFAGDRGDLATFEAGIRQKYTFYARSFPNSSLTALNFPKPTKTKFEEFAFFHGKLNTIGSWGIKEDYINVNIGAFAANEFKKLVLPRDFYGHNRAFTDNLLLEEIACEEGDTPGTAGFYENTFENSALKGEVVIPDGIGTLGGGYTFRGTKIEKLVLPNREMTIGWRTAEGLKTLHTLVLNHANYIEYRAFADAGLKNIDFSNVTASALGAEIFKTNQLKALEIPNHLTTLKDNILADNIGWKDGDKRVALYRKNFADNTYVTDNVVKDTEDFVINPVDVEFKFVDQNGTAVAGAVKNIKNSSDRPANEYKLGDKVSFEVDIPEDFTLKSVAGQAAAEGQTAFTVELSEIAKEVKYGEDYHVGYQKAEIKVEYQRPQPAEPYIQPNNDDNNDNNNNNNNNNNNSNTNSSETAAPAVTPTEVIAEEEVAQGNPEAVPADPELEEVLPEMGEIEDEEVALGEGKLPKTDGIPASVMTIFGLGFLGAGFGFRRRK